LDLGIACGQDDRGGALPGQGLLQVLLRHPSRILRQVSGLSINVHGEGIYLQRLHGRGGRQWVGDIGHDLQCGRMLEEIVAMERIIAGQAEKMTNDE
jgi:hypothetical protein